MRSSQSGFIEIYIILSLSAVLILASYLWRYVYLVKKLDSLHTKESKIVNENTAKNFIAMKDQLRTGAGLSIIANHNSNIRTQDALSYPVFATQDRLPTLDWKTLTNIPRENFVRNQDLLLTNSVLSEQDMKINRLEIDGTNNELFLISLGNIKINEIVYKTSKPAKNSQIIYIIALSSLNIENIIKQIENSSKILLYSATSSIEIDNQVKESLCNNNRIGTILLRGRKLLVNSSEIPKESVWACKDSELLRIFTEHRIIGYHEH